MGGSVVPLSFPLVNLRAKTELSAVTLVPGRVSIPLRKKLQHRLIDNAPLEPVRLFCRTPANGRATSIERWGAGRLPSSEA
jgi:hypothetical protein